MRISIIQLDVGDGNKAARIAHVLRLIDRAAGSDLILLPELWPSGYFAFDRYRSESETIDGDTVAALADKARSVRSHLFAGSFVECDSDSLFNTSILLSPAGKLVATYRKIHLFGFKSDERNLLTAGNAITVADTPFGKIGVTTCYDLRFPELYRAMVDQGAEFFLVCAAWPKQRLEAWRLFNRARAHENLAFLMSCNCAGSNRGTVLAGHSMIVDPLGTIVAEAGEGEEIITAEIDPAQVGQARSSFSALHDRSPLFKPARGTHA
jgi:predicted amidohydrolase